MHIQQLSGSTTGRLEGLIALLLLGFVLFSVSPSYAQVPLPQSTLIPTDPGTGPADRNVPFLAWHEDLSAVGYVEREYQLSGLANIYSYVNNTAQSPAVRVATANRPYTTRILVRRPKTGRKFNGVIYLEILNATARYDGAPMWNLTYESIIASGAICDRAAFASVDASSVGQVPRGAAPQNRATP